MKKELVKRIVPDTSVIVDGRITELMRSLKDKEKVEIIIPETIVSELEHLANLGKEVGFEGLSELNLVKEIAEKSKGKIVLRFFSSKEQGKGDEIIRRIAEKHNALLITSDKIQNLVSETKGLKTLYMEPKIKIFEPVVFKFFDSETASIHLKEDTYIMAKKGEVGNFRLVRISEEKISREDMENYAREIIEYAHSEPKSYIELERRGATILQIKNFRIVISRPPFSGGMEITVVKPLVKKNLSDYKISENLLRRLEEKAEGIFIAGAPGQGKTTFASALAEFFLEKKKIVKTIEQPRDMQLPPEITQYSLLEGSPEKTFDILLLVRPDYVIFDEVRKTRDFEVFADLRLAGVGMIGVTHANKAIDAIQRFVRRVELGMIPHIIDTVIFIDAGRIKEVYELEMKVKVPYGMRDVELSRPVIEVRDFESKRLEYELYSYGEEVVVIPIKERLRVGSGEEYPLTEKEPKIDFTKRIIILRSKKFRDKGVRIFANEKEIFSSRVNNAGNIKINRNSHQGHLLLEAIKANKKISIRQ